MYTLKQKIEAQNNLIRLKQELSQKSKYYHKRIHCNCGSIYYMQNITIFKDNYKNDYFNCPYCERKIQLTK